MLQQLPLLEALVTTTISHSIILFFSVRHKETHDDTPWDKQICKDRVQAVIDNWGEKSVAQPLQPEVSIANNMIDRLVAPLFELMLGKPRARDKVSGLSGLVWCV